MTTQQLPRHVRQQLAALRLEWRYWRNPGRYGAPIDFCITCANGGCGECEGCAMTLYRADQLADVQARAAAIKASA